jgi:hypothetical protein
MYRFFGLYSKTHQGGSSGKKQIILIGALGENLSHPHLIPISSKMPPWTA